ncbi:MAG: hypothetical protein LBP38_06435 [Desulfovibrio sp.]|nr:hypothetical protein [Desulfovibrio sp.]
MFRTRPGDRAARQAPGRRLPPVRYRTYIVGSVDAAGVRSSADGIRRTAAGGTRIDCLTAFYTPKKKTLSYQGRCWQDLRGEQKLSPNRRGKRSRGKHIEIIELMLH